MRAIPKREADPASPYWKPKSAAMRIDDHIKELPTPQALIVYWRQHTVQKRLQALPETWRRELARRYETRLASLNDTGPYPEEIVKRESDRHGPYCQTIGR
jgi:hypothetical protein